MANFVKDFLGYLRLNEDDDLEDYIEDFEEEKPKVFPKTFTREKEVAKPTKRSVSRPEKTTSREEEPLRERSVRMERTTNNKIVPIRTTPKGLEVCIMKPNGFEDSQDICDMLLTGRAAVVNLEGFDPEDAQRVMDFISGCVYAINGKLHQISRYIFIFSPETVDISGDYLDIMPEIGFDVPTLSKEF
ncbi:MAG: cell division inhibitor SepF [Clostridiales bacterium]|nr:cell division inhibitor SepF [Clostridiales bacterium]